jgi:putative DNA primase/helicase
VLRNSAEKISFANLPERSASADVENLHAQCLQLLKAVANTGTSRQRRRQHCEELDSAVGHLAERAAALGRAKERSEPKYAVRLERGESSPPELAGLRLTVQLQDLRREIQRAGSGHISGKRLKAFALDAPRKVREIIEVATLTGRLQRAQDLRASATPIIEHGHWARDKHRIKQALHHIDPGCVYSEWVNVGMAIHHASGGSAEGFALFHDWSRGEFTDEGSPVNYKDRKDCLTRWRSFKDEKERLVTLGTLIWMAQQGGYRRAQEAKVAYDTLTANVALRRGSDIEMEPIEWLWEGWLAAGKLHVLAGRPGTGKTTVALALAATVTHGGVWPDGSKYSEPGNVIMWSGEDDPADTLVPRLAAMDADLSRIHFVGDVKSRDGRRPFDPALDMPALIAKARAVGDVKLLIVDPVVTVVAGDSHRNAEVRRALAPLVQFGQGLRAAVLGISHFSKGTSGQDPLDRVTGSLAFGALARVVLGAAKQIGSDGNETGRVLVRIKSNIGPDGNGVAYTLAPTNLPGGIATARIVWGAKVIGSALDIIAEAEQNEAGDDRSAGADAVEFLRGELESGPVATVDLQKRAEHAGLSWATVRRAKGALGVKARKAGMEAGWTWEMPAHPVHSTEDALAGD